MEVRMDDFKVIYSYTRAQAIADGVLVDVTNQAKETGFTVPAAVTDHLFNGYIVPPQGLEGEGQSIEGRLHDTLWMILTIARASRDSSRVETDVLFLMTPGQWEKVRVVAVIGPGDSGEPVLTIMLPGDD
jgi:hypothetical protein